MVVNGVEDWWGEDWDGWGWGTVNRGRRKGWG